jgi:hypothetical protein
MTFCTRADYLWMRDFLQLSLITSWSPTIARPIAAMKKEDWSKRYLRELMCSRLNFV